ncbi:transcription elongation factor GreA, partial [Streptococcus pneumoniae]
MMKRCSSRYIFILFEQLFKPRQRRLAVGMV